MAGDKQPWLNIIGIGEDGVDGLSASAMAALEVAEVIIGGDRHHNLAPNVTAKRLSWPSPFDAMIDEIKSHKGKKLVILVTGDPLWYSVGARISRSMPTNEIRFHPQLSAFQWAAARMGWSLADVDTLTVHGRPVEQIIPHFSPNVKLLVLTKDQTSPNDIAKLLTERGFGKSRLTVLAALGGPNEKRFDGIAETWAHLVPDFHTLAIECVVGSGAKFYPRTGGLPDDAFEHDGQMTKRVVRAATISALKPYPDALLWDIGAGCGSIAIEWMRAARGAEAIAIEGHPERLKMIAANATALGTPRLRVVDGNAPDVLDGLPQPDAVFIGGGLTTTGLFETAYAALRGGGVLVANAVTLESEVYLVRLQAEFGGLMDRISVSEAIPVGRYKAMKPFMTVTQLTLQKPYPEEAGE
ncbi:MAG: precorrin-6y C5,15-methyltransferase (decarboxylating) subunit CbiE [Salaquimonas sp.]